MKIIILSLLLTLILISSSLSLQISDVEPSYTIFRVNFENETEITDKGGTLEGSYSFVNGIRGNAIKLVDDASVSFPVQGIINESAGTVSLWIKPNFDIRNMPQFSSVALLEVGDFPFIDTFGVWVYRSEYGPVLVLEIKDAFGNYKQAWSEVTSFAPNRWHYVWFRWRCNTRYSYAGIAVDKLYAIAELGMCRRINFLDTDTIRIGTNGYHSDRTKVIDNLRILRP